MGLALLFPGQGAQIVGMGKDLRDAHPGARALFEKAQDRLPWDLEEVTFHGPEEALAATGACQVAIYVTSMAVWEIWKEVPGAPEILASAGLSLGEYTALAAAGALTFEEGLDLVTRRGALMQEACEAREGTMASVLGLAAEAVEEAVAGTEGVVAVANYNAPTQIVITGETGAVRAAGERCREAGAKRVLELNVAGAYHSPLMAPAQEALEPHLREAVIEEPRYPVILNVSGRATRDPEEIRHGLIEQVTSPVRWVESMESLRSLEVERAVELGPGTVLKGLLRKVDRKIPVESFCSLESMRGG